MNKTLALIVAIAVVAAAWFYFNRDSPEEQVRRTLDELRVEAAKPVTMQGVSRIAQIQSLKKFLTDDIVIEVASRQVSFKGSASIVKYAQGLYPNLKKFDISLADQNVVLSPDGQTAVVNLTVVASGTTSQNWRQFQELKITLVNKDGDWLISRGEAVEALTLE